MIHLALLNARTLALLGLAAALAACGSPVVGAECAPGYRPSNGTCEAIPPGVLRDASPDIASDTGQVWVSNDAGPTMYINVLGRPPARDGGVTPDDVATPPGSDGAMASVDTGVTSAGDAMVVGGMDAGLGSDASATDDTGVVVADASATSSDDSATSGDDSASGDDASSADSASSADVASSDDAFSAPTCTSGTACGAACVDVTTDPANCGACGVVCDASQVCARGTCTSTCPVPLVDCSGACVDLQTDEMNCGACGHVCTSGICNAGICRDARAGHIVLIGHSFTGTRPDEVRILRNAVFLGGGATTRALVYDQYADRTPGTGAVAQVDAAITGTGRPWTRTALSDPTRVSSQLSVDHFDVMLVYAQSSATDAQIADVATDFGDALASFARAGGVVVVLDGDTANSGTYPIAVATTLLDVTGATPVTDAVVTLPPSAAADAVAAGVGTSYRSMPTTVVFTTTAPYGVFFQGGSPVVLHHAVL